MKQLFGKTFQVIEKALDLRIRRNAVITANVANVDTPGYKAKDLPFREVMARYLDQLPEPSELHQTRQRHFDQQGRYRLFSNKDGESAPRQYMIFEGQDPLSRTDPHHYVQGQLGPASMSESALQTSLERGTPNNVDPDQEMAKLAANNLQYQATIQALVKEIEILKTAITEGGKA